MELGPAGDADQDGVGQRRPVAGQEGRVADHRFQLGMALGDGLAAEVAQGLAIGRIGRAPSPARPTSGLKAPVKPVLRKAMS